MDTHELEKGHESILSGIEGLKKFAGAAAAAFAVKEIYEFVMGLAEEAAALGRHAAALGMSITQLQEWNYAAKLSGVSSDTLTASLARLTGGKYNADAMTELGVSVKNANGEMKDGPALLGDIADKLIKIDNPAKRNKLAMGVLGRSYLELMPLLADGSEGIEKLGKDFEGLGGGFTEQSAKDAEELNHSVDRMKTLWKGLSITVVTALLPTLMSLGKSLVAASKPLIAMLKHTQLLKVGMIALATKGLMQAATKIVPLGKAFKMLAGDVLLTVAALLIIEDLFTFLTGGKSLIGRGLDKAFGPGTGKEAAMEVKGFFGDMFADGHKFGDDMKLLWKSLVQDVAVGISMLVTRAASAWDELGSGADIVWTEIKFWGLEAAASLSDAFDGLWRSVLVGARTAMAFLPGMGDAVKGIDASIAGLDRSKAKGGAVAEIQGLHAKETQRIVTEHDTKLASRKAEYEAARATGSGYAPIPTTAIVNVTVPSGTPAEVAKRVGDAAAKGVHKPLRAVAAALAPGKG